jgi:hypothetical protein
MSKVRVFMSFDLENDEDLHDLFLEQCSRGDSGFEISAASESGMVTARWDKKVRRRICDADEVIVLCGEHTSASIGVSAEVRIAQEEQKPYFLVWGRRDSMCTKPAAARPTDTMYSWTWEILQNQIMATLHKSKNRNKGSTRTPYR